MDEEEARETLKVIEDVAAFEVEAGDGR
jgi:hypothetical protein